MKILHIADIHLGTELYGHYDPRTGVSSRLKDFTDALDRAIDYAIATRVDLFLFAGDAYKTRDPNPTQQREFALRLRRLLDAAIPVFLLTGNHDMPNALGRATSLDIFGTLQLPHLYVAARPAVHLVETVSGPLQVVAVPWISRSTLMTRDEIKNKPVGEVNRELLERLAEFLQGATASLDPGIPAILTLHGSIAGASFGGERSTMLGHDLLIPRNLVANPAFAYVALGHIHKHQVLSADPPIVYAGSPERIDFGEERDPKGFVVLDIDGTNVAHWRFIDSGARPFKTIRVEAFDDDPTAQVVEAVESVDVAGAIVRLVVHLRDANQSSYNESRVRAALRAAYHVSSLREIDRADRLRGSGFSTAFTPLENLTAYLEKQESCPPARAAVLMDYARCLVHDLEGPGPGDDAAPAMPLPSSKESSSIMEASS